MAYLVLVRHGLSEYNKLGIWTGLKNPELAPEGLDDAKKAGTALNDISFDYAYTSLLTRHIQTLDLIISQLDKKDIMITKSKALNERDYGDYTGKNKWEVQKLLGEEEFKKLRRGWDYPIPNGESLKQVYLRVVDYYKSEIEPKILNDENILISSSGNALRSLVKYIESISDDAISDLEIAPGEVYVYKFENGKLIDKEIRCQKENIY